MNEVIKFISREKYEEECTSLKEGEWKVIYNSDEIKITLTKEGKKIRNIIVNYGNIPIQDTVKNLLIQA